MKKQVLALVIIAPVLFAKDVRAEDNTGPKGSFRTLPPFVLYSLK